MIKDKLGIEAALTPGELGQLAVAVDGELIDAKPQGFWKRFLSGGRPDEERVIAALRQRMEG